jgi:hypothetical protein
MTHSYREVLKEPRTLGLSRDRHHAGLRPPESLSPPVPIDHP